MTDNNVTSTDESTDSPAPKGQFDWQVVDDHVAHYIGRYVIGGFLAFLGICMIWGLITGAGSDSSNDTGCVGCENSDQFIQDTQDYIDDYKNFTDNN